MYKIQLQHIQSLQFDTKFSEPNVLKLGVWFVGVALIVCKSKTCHCGEAAPYLQNLTRNFTKTFPIQKLTVPWTTSFKEGLLSVAVFTLISFTRGLIVLP